MRRSTLLASLGISALLSVPALSSALAADVLPYPAPPITDPIYTPAPMITGDVSIGLSYYSEEDGYNVWDIFGSARANMPLGGLWYTTGEIFGLAALNYTHYREFGGALHFYHKTPQSAHGVYVTGAHYGETKYNGNAVSVGIEGAAFLGAFTLTGYADYTWGSDNGGGSYNSWGAAGVATYYLTPNTSIAAAVGVWDDAEGWGLGARGEHLFAGTQMSMFANTAWYNNRGYDSWQVAGGIRLFFHNPGATLQQRDWDAPFSATRF